MNPFEKLSLLLRLIILVRNWPLYVANRLGWVKRDVLTYKLRSGLRLNSRSFTIDRGTLNDVWLEGSYEPKNFGIAWGWQSCTMIVDVGANIGTFTLFAACKARNAHIISIEPEPGNLSMLRRNVDQNHLNDRIAIIEAAISAKSGKEILHISTQVSGGHSLFEHKQHGQTITVRAMTLAEVLQGAPKPIDFLKLDCEGAEYQALYGLSGNDLQRIRMLAVECHNFSSDPTHNQSSLEAFLREQGFMITQGKKSMFFAGRK